MWLTLDIGNSAAKGGLYAGDTQTRIVHIGHRTHPARGPEAQAAWQQVLRAELGDTSVERVGIASVVPSVTDAATAALKQVFSVPVEHVHPGWRLPFALAYRTPETLGTDRLAAAAAAWVEHGADGPHPVIALDAGTAVTLDVITHTGTYEGGLIAPGPALLRRALHDGTGQLPAVPLKWPEHLIGRSTQEALQSGIMRGFVESVRGLLAQLTAALDAPPVVIATGGWSHLLADHIDAIDHVNPHLVLDGIRVLMELNPPPAAD